MCCADSQRVICESKASFSVFKWAISYASLSLLEARFSITGRLSLSGPDLMGADHDQGRGEQCPRYLLFRLLPGGMASWERGGPDGISSPSYAHYIQRAYSRATIFQVSGGQSRAIRGPLVLPQGSLEISRYWSVCL